MPLILTCTDGSIYGPSIYQHAAWAALRLDAEVELLHVIEHHREHADTLDLSGAIGFNASAELTEELAKLEEAQSRVRAPERQSHPGGGPPATGRRRCRPRRSHPTSWNTRGNASKSWSRARTSWSWESGGEHGAEGPLGEHLEALVRISQRPVLVANLTFRPIHRILIAFDDSPSSRKAVEHVTASPLLRGLECHLIMVGQSDAAHERALIEARDQLTRAGFSVIAQLLPGKATVVIGDKVRSTGIDLLMMGAYGHSHIREFIVGSTTTRLIQTCAVPVLLFR